MLPDCRGFVGYVSTSMTQSNIFRGLFRCVSLTDGKRVETLIHACHGLWHLGDICNKFSAATNSERA